MKSFRIPLKAVLYKENEIWLAHCLEFDLIGDGQTPTHALKNLSKAIAVQVKASIKHKCLQNLFVPADAKYWAMFAVGKKVALGELELKKRISSVTIEEVDARQYSDSVDSVADLIHA